MQRQEDTRRIGEKPSSTTLNPIINEIISSTISSKTLVDREQIRREFYATYDYMTGVRIATTLGAFFGLMVLLIVCKSKSKTLKALDDPNFAAAAAEAVAEVEAVEEEVQVLKTMLQTPETWIADFPRSSRHARYSLGNMSAPAEFIGARQSPRFSSVGSNILSPLVRSPGSALKFQKQPTCLEFSEDYNDDESIEVPNDFDFLKVRQQNDYFRRSSNTTCSSSESAYLERQESSVVGLPPPPPLKTPRRKSSAEKNWDFYYPIEIQVIGATPAVSPSCSERKLNKHKLNDIELNSLNNIQRRLAPLATISSCTSSVLGVSSSSADLRSYDSDSVFADNISCCSDTDDEITQFSTDSDEVFQANKYLWKRHGSAPIQRRKSYKSTKPSKQYDSTKTLVRSPKEQFDFIGMKQFEIELKQLGEIKSNKTELPSPNESSTSTFLAPPRTDNRAFASLSEDVHKTYLLPLYDKAASTKLTKALSLVNIDLKNKNHSKETLF